MNTQEQKNKIFLRATQSFSGSTDRWAERAKTGLSDDELSSALSYELGEFGGGSIGNSGFYIGTKHGLKIAGYYDRSEHPTYNTHQNYPIICKGSQTVKYAREIYSIPYPHEVGQGTLF